MKNILIFVGLLALTTMGASAAQPVPWQYDFQPAASPAMQEVIDLHNFVLWIIVIISVFVMGLLAYVLYRFHESRHKKPSTVTHNATLEIAWTVIPALILVVMAVPSFKLLYYMDTTPSADLTIKATGYQWYWSYEYPDHGEFTFDSLMKEEDELADNEPRLLAVDEPMLVPVGAIVRMLIAADPDGVIHSWAVPSLGVKTDAVPGRLNETWFKIEQEGIYYGQCSELCGVNHAFMPIAVKAVSQQEFKSWVQQKQQDNAMRQQNERKRKQLSLNNDTYSRNPS